MLVTRLKTKNQVTIPQQIVEAMNLKFEQLFAITMGENCIKLTPVDAVPLHELKDTRHH